MLTQTNPQINKAVGVLMEISADERNRMLYESREKLRRDEASRMKGAVKIAVKGAVEGTKTEIARNALKKNMPIDDIADITGLTREEIEGLGPASES
jgi:predicted transposase/invertase (TIGR01784 family)